MGPSPTTTKRTDGLACATSAAARTKRPGDFSGAKRATKPTVRHPSAWRHPKRDASSPESNNDVHGVSVRLPF